MSRNLHVPAPDPRNPTCTVGYLTSEKRRGEGSQWNLPHPKESIHGRWQALESRRHSVRPVCHPPRGGGVTAPLSSNTDSPTPGSPMTPHLQLESQTYLIIKEKNLKRQYYGKRIGTRSDKRNVPLITTDKAGMGVIKKFPLYTGCFS